jgi:GTP cyclohydrolase IA
MPDAISLPFALRPTLANVPMTELSDADRAGIEAEVADAWVRLMDALRIRPGPHTHDTPRRVARMMVQEVFAGRFNAKPDMTTFPNGKVDQVYVVGPIAIRSCCAHHFVPIIGKAWVAVLPSDRLIGLSKVSRLAEWVFCRPQIQEEATEQLAEELESAVQPRGLGLRVVAQHFCCAWRGVRDADQRMTTQVMRGKFRADAALRAEVVSLFDRAGG